MCQENFDRPLHALHTGQWEGRQLVIGSPGSKCRNHKLHECWPLFHKRRPTIDNGRQDIRVAESMLIHRQMPQEHVTHGLVKRSVIIASSNFPPSVSSTTADMYGWSAGSIPRLGSFLFCSWTETSRKSMVYYNARGFDAPEDRWAPLFAPG